MVYTLKLTNNKCAMNLYKMNMVTMLKVVGQLCYLFFVVKQFHFQVRNKQLEQVKRHELGKHELGKHELGKHELENENKLLRNKVEEQEAQIHFMSCHS